MPKRFLPAKIKLSGNTLSYDVSSPVGFSNVETFEGPSADAIQTKITAVETKLKESIVQTTGDSETLVISQKALTALLKDINDSLAAIKKDVAAIQIQIKPSDENVIWQWKTTSEKS